jgi:hypothetical protein
MGSRNNFNYWIASLTTIFIFLFYFFPYFYLGDDSFITIHDNLDSDIVWFKTISESGKLFAFSNEIKIDNIMNGIPRNSLPSAFNFISILFYLLEPFNAYLLNKIMTHLVAFAGMFLLLKDFVWKKNEEIFFLFSISLIFSLIPFYGTQPGLAIAGIPFISWCFIHFYKYTYKYYHFLILLFFTFYSSLIYSGVFIIIILSSIFIYLLLFKKKINRPFIFGIIILISGYIISELNLFFQYFSNDFVSHRIEWSDNGVNFLDSLKVGFSFFLFGQYHTPSLNSPFVTLICLVGFICSLIYLKIKHKHYNYLEILIIIIFLFLITISTFFGFWSSIWVNELKGKISFLRILNWNRFIWLTPFLWYILLALSIKVIVIKSKKYAIKFILYMFILMQFLFLIYSNIELKQNYYKIIARNIPEISSFKKASKQPSFKQFYDKFLFLQIKEYIGLPQSQYRVISLGIYPEISVYNGFYSLDSYQRNYSLNYKHDFRKIISSELNKSGIIKNYFDNWGSRCYAFSAELNINNSINKHDKILIKNLNFDFDILKKMGGKYLISTVLIDTINNRRVVFKKSFEHQNSFWKIYLYEVI